MRVGEGDEFVHLKHETPHFSQWRRRHLKWHHEMQYVMPHHGNNKEGGSLLDLEVGHKCNESTHS